MRWSSEGSMSAALCALALAATASAPPACAAPPKRDVPYEPSSAEAVRAMVDLAGVGPSDVVFDLGCGDGRVLVEAARRGARAIGVEIDPRLAATARENARAAGVADRVEVREGDLFEADLTGATAVLLFLWPHVNLKLRPKLLAELRPGTRIVSHWHDMGDWKPERTVRVAGNPIYLWTVPARPGP
jgi:SAM-dependent methyltransferase